ncbi:hypothetical protein [Desulfonatronum parangueonense]
MIKKFRTLSQKRRMLREQIQARHGELHLSRQLLVEKTHQYLGTKHAVTQAFVVGYLVDQLRSLMPGKLTQLRFYLPWVMRYMQ